MRYGVRRKQNGKRWRRPKRPLKRNRTSRPVSDKG